MKDGWIAECSIFEGYSLLLKQRWHYERLSSKDASDSVTVLLWAFLKTQTTTTTTTTD